MDIIILIIILIFIIAPLSLLFHEIGHVIGAKFRKATNILLTVGVGKSLGSFNIQNISINIRTLFVVNSFTSTVREDPFTNKEKIFITLMGPFFSLLLTIIFFGLYYTEPTNQYYYVAFLFNAWLVLVNLVPYKLGQKQSDGYIIVKLVAQTLRN